MLYFMKFEQFGEISKGKAFENDCILLINFQINLCVRGWVCLRVSVFVGDFVCDCVCGCVCFSVCVSVRERTDNYY